MILITYHATPKRAPIEATDTAGAYINCWVNTYDYDKALELSASFIDTQNWAIDEVEDIGPICKDDYEETAEELKYFNEAIEADECYVFYTYPLEDEKEELSIF